MTARTSQHARREDPLAATLALRERYRDWYLRHRDPIAESRMLWRAQSFRQLVHLLPGQSILELGCGSGIFTRQLAAVSRGENPITAVTFGGDAGPAIAPPPGAPVTRVAAPALPGPLAGRRFDYVVAMDLLDRRTAAELLRQVHDLLAPGGQV
ncbi:MAG TPA: class I SAM-dependent methyltransferase, partial [Gemmatimonadaceae bacterium]|nr:class I SAM-dependent methyltransferase [Gemmatimonadaceae bacterium]